VTRPLRSAAWDAAHPEAREAEALVRIAQQVADQLCDPMWARPERGTLIRQMRQARSALMGVDLSKQTSARRLRVVHAMDLAQRAPQIVDELDPGRWAELSAHDQRFARRQLARATLTLVEDFGVPDGILDAAIDAWPSKWTTKKKAALMALTGVMRCGFENAETMRKQLDIDALSGEP